MKTFDLALWLEWSIPEPYFVAVGKIYENIFASLGFDVVSILTGLGYGRGERVFTGSLRLDNRQRLSPLVQKKVIEIPAFE